MTEATLAMLLATAGLALCNVAAVRRPSPRLRAGLAAASAFGGPLAVYSLFTLLSHGSEMSNIGDGLLLVVLLPAHFFGWLGLAMWVLARSRGPGR